MSTRATIHFLNQGDDTPQSIIYRHSDGYPDGGLGCDLSRFFDEIQSNLSDTRFNDPSYLAAKWVVWDANRHLWPAPRLAPSAEIAPLVHRCDFLSVGVVLTDPPDIQYRFLIICSEGFGEVDRPTVVCQKLDICDDTDELIVVSEANVL